jgi:hypothetical protein
MVIVTMSVLGKMVMETGMTMEIPSTVYVMDI